MNQTREQLQAAIEAAEAKEAAAYAKMIAAGPSALSDDIKETLIELHHQAHHAKMDLLDQLRGLDSPP